MASGEVGLARQLYEELFEELVVKGEGATIGELRERYDAFFMQFPFPDDATLEELDTGGVPALSVVVAGGSTDRTILYLHSGGYVLGSARGSAETSAALSRAAGARVVSVDYRLAPEHPYPAAVEDATAAYRSLVAGGAAPASIVIVGDSSGGGLAVALLLALRDGGEALPAGAVLVSPWTDMALTGKSLESKAKEDPIISGPLMQQMVALYLAGGDPRAPLASPLYGELSGLPPLLIIAGTAETLLDDATRLADRAREAGVDVTLEVADQMVHMFPTFSSFLPEGREALQTIGRFVKEPLTFACREAG